MTGDWRVALPEADAERARNVALEVASRLVDPTLVDATLARSGRALAEAGAQARGWSGPGLSGANCAVALLCAQLDRAEPGAGWDRRGHVALSVAAEAAGRNGTPLGLFEGLAGLGFSAQRLAADRDRYGGLLESVDDVLTGVVGSRCAELVRARGMPVRDWDLISGLTGIGVHLLARRERPAARAALEQILATLVELGRDDGGGPRWVTPAEHVGVNLRAATPEGNLNCGLAHGVPGPLALMSLALLAGVEVPGQVEATRRAAAWLSEQGRPCPFGPRWPAALALGAGVEPPPARPGWCYGNAGVARALWLAGRALDEPAYTRLALEALREALERQRSERPLDAPTICHGGAGLAQVALRIGAESGEADVAARARDLCRELLDWFDADAPFGYRDVTAGRSEPRLEVDDPTLLSGAAGTALVLLAGATDNDPGWDRALLLS
jgi:lantibiotic biosynthesis protein